jgi:hypothetical protein
MLLLPEIVVTKLPFVTATVFVFTVAAAFDRLW